MLKEASFLKFEIGLFLGVLLGIVLGVLLAGSLHLGLYAEPKREKRAAFSRLAIEARTVGRSIRDEGCENAESFGSTKLSDLKLKLEEMSADYSPNNINNDISANTYKEMQTMRMYIDRCF